MQGHSDGEVWGLDIDGDFNVVTSADDNKVLVYSLEERKCIAKGVVDENAGPPRKRGASTLSNYPPN